MGVTTGNPLWRNFPDTSTPVSASALNKIEQAIDDIAGSSGSGTPGPPGADGADGADGTDVTLQKYPTRADLPLTGDGNSIYVTLEP